MNEAEEKQMSQRAGEHATARGFVITGRLGWGVHGSVWKVAGKEQPCKFPGDIRGPGYMRNLSLRNTLRSRHRA
jgi:hypothetical protein